MRMTELVEWLRDHQSYITRVSVPNFMAIHRIVDIPYCQPQSGREEEEGSIKKSINHQS